MPVCPVESSLSSWLVVGSAVRDKPDFRLLVFASAASLCVSGKQFTLAPSKSSKRSLPMHKNAVMLIERCCTDRQSDQ